MRERSNFHVTTFLNSILYIFLKVKSSEFLQIRGKEAKQTQKSKLGIPQQRQGRCTKPQQDQKLPKKK